jgi:oxygen-independent coproporphyrinogen-3 oxidase
VVTEVLTGNGYREYGAFNYARPGFESVHNEIAFVAPQGEYAGFGNSSYSFINGAVYCNYAELTRYEEAVFAGRDPIALARRATGLEMMSRYFVLGLKFFRVSRQPFIDRFGLPPEQIFGPVFERLTGKGLLRRDGDDYVLTRTGRHYVNNVAKEFYVGESTSRRQYAQFVPNITPKQIDFYARKAGAGT